MHIWNNVEFAGTGTLNSTLSVLSVFWARIFFVQLNSFEISLPTLLASNNNSIPKQITFLSERDCKFQFISSKRINFIFGTIREFIIAPAAHNIRLNLSILRLVNNLHGSHKNCSKSIPWASAHHSHTHTHYRNRVIHFRFHELWMVIVRYEWNVPWSVHCRHISCEHISQ